MSLVSETVTADEEDRYCVCRGSYGNKFMIGCDGCDEWFHGTCIKIDSDQAKFVEKYYCPFCVEKDPTLKTRYKPNSKERMREKDKQREREKEKTREKDKHREKDRMKKKEHRKSKPILDSDSDDQIRKPKLEIPKKKSENKLQFIKKSKIIFEDREIKPGNDETSVKPKSHSEVTKQKPIKEETKQKPIKDEIKHKEMVDEQHHIKNVKSTKDDLKLKEEMFDFSPTETSPIKDKKRREEIKDKKKEEITEKKKEENKDKKREEIKEKKKEETKDKKKEENKEKKVDFTVKEKKTPVIAESDSDDDANFDSFLSSIAPPPPSSSENEEVDVGVESMVVDREPVKEQPKDKPKHHKKKGRPKKNQLSSQKSRDGCKIEPESSDEEELQCLGPGCCQAARRASRYCSEECGVQLAIKRIKTFLPERKEEMKRGGVARRFDEDMIRDLEEQQKVAHQKVEELQKVRVVIMKLIDNARETSNQEGGSDDDMSDDEIETEGIDCVTCGMACTNKTAVKHMERCYNKFEAQLSLGSTVKCGITWESPVCDSYDRQQGSYCKKLKVLCPDHNKEKEDHGGICGCPVDLTNITENSTVCTRSKRACNRHISWEKLRLAEIDMERVQQCLKLEDSFDEMRKVKYRMANRTNLLQILLNGTIHHGDSVFG